MAEQDTIFDAALMPEILERTLSPRDIERRGGPSVERTQLFWESFGLPVDDPDEPAFSEAEAAVFAELEDMTDVFPPEVGVQVARVYGRLLARIAQTEVQIFRVFVEPRLREGQNDPMDALIATRDAFARLLPVSGPLLLSVHRRWLEHHIAQEVVTAAESEPGSLPGQVSVSFLFCDLKGFTAFAQERGDEAAVAAIDRFASVVSREKGRESRFTKALGDGFMLVYGEAAEAVAAGRRIIDAMKADGVPAVHASAHTGTAIAREGDYFGGAVNLASRLLDAADGDELVATEATVTAAGADYAWSPAGSVGVRGLREPVPAFSLRV